MKNCIPHPARATRRGVILLVVLALLTLFAVIGICFVLYAQTAAQASRLYREAELSSRPDVAPEKLLAYFLGQLIYDLPDDPTGVYSGLRGHSLARSMYGGNDTAPNVVPFNGSGRLHFDSALKGMGLADLPAVALADLPAVALDDYYLINYTFFRDDPQLLPEQRSLRDPERLGARAGLEAPRGLFTGGANAPYTYPDLNSLFLAAVKADGTVLMPSFHRPWLFGSTDRSNDNWTNVAGKYLILRPRPIDQKRDPNDPTEPESFPYPEDEGGDVKNLIGAPGGNDSFWIDLDFPVLTAPDGRKYKPLFAPLITDLDNRVNVNVHGNIRGLNASHVSNQGWGPWEVNLNWVLNQGDEWRQLLLGDGTQPQGIGRYGPDQVPSSPPANVAAFGTVPHFYSQIDADGYNYDQAPYSASSPLQLPGFGTAPLQCFPSYPSGYGNGSVVEGTNHPSLYNAFQPAGDDRVFAASNLEALLRYGDTGSAGLTSELFRLCPQNFGDPADPLSAARRRNLVTTHSFDLDRPGLTPWIWDASSSQYRLTAGSAFPSGSAVAFPSLSLRSTASVPARSDFQMPGLPPDDPRVDWRAVGAALGRVDLNRRLPDYPAPDPVTAQIRSADLPAFGQAQAARVQLARDIFERLRLVTGAAPPAQVRVGSPQFDALRWLAQLAVNIVDYIDTDDYMTPFPWYTDARGTVHVVYGTELPRVVLNEAYVEIGNDPHDPGLHSHPKQPQQPRRAQRDFIVNFWVELLNPFRRDPTLADNGAARLQVPGPGYAVYQVVVARTPNQGLQAPANVRGDPDPGQTLLVLNHYTADPSGPPPDPAIDVLRIEPLDGRQAGAVGQNQGFYVLGPAADFPGTPPHTRFATLRVAEQVSDGLRSGLSYRVPNTTRLASLPMHALFLRRLACPHLPPNPAPNGLFNPKLPPNPYITVDTMTPVPMNDGVRVDAEGPHVPTPVAQRMAYGRLQPYAASPLLLRPQWPTMTVLGQPRHTFFRHNQPCQSPFDWLVHLDRPLISPLELFQVSAFKPHQLTHRFQTPGQPFDHHVPWTQPELRLYRVFEFLETHGRAEGLSPVPGGRIPGKINLNTVWDPETFLALCDPQPGNVFQSQDLYRPLGQGSGFDDPDEPQTVYWRLMLSRTPALLKGGGPGPKDRPFQSLAAGQRPPSDTQFPAGGLNDTLLRADPVEPGKRLFEIDSEGPSQAHPYLRDQLLTKIFNHVTTRSHVFAVWVTVGLFEVTDAGTRPVKLGAEIGRAENRHVRHRFFAIVDRSQLTLSGDAGFVMSATSEVPEAPADVTVAVPALSGTSEGLPWAIRPGCRLVVDVGAAQEVVTVTAVSAPDMAPAFQASFTKPHPAGFAVTNLGNPGPQPGFNPRNQPGVVRYFSIID